MTESMRGWCGQFSWKWCAKSFMRASLPIAPAVGRIFLAALRRLQFSHQPLSALTAGHLMEDSTDTGHEERNGQEVPPQCVTAAERCPPSTAISLA
jgi:hypothetical protein